MNAYYKIGKSTEKKSINIEFGHGVVGNAGRATLPSCRLGQRSKQETGVHAMRNIDEIRGLTNAYLKNAGKRVQAGELYKVSDEKSYYPLFYFKDTTNERFLIAVAVAVEFGEDFIQRVMRTDRCKKHYLLPGNKPSRGGIVTLIETNE